MEKDFIKQFILSKKGLGLSKDDIYRLALLSFGTEWENLILMMLCEIEKENGTGGQRYLESE
jgi:hypothetical protein